MHRIPSGPEPAPSSHPKHNAATAQGSGASALAIAQARALGWQPQSWLAAAPVAGTLYGLTPLQHCRQTEAFTWARERKLTGTRVLARASDTHRLRL